MVQQGSFAFKKRCGNAPTRRVVICRVEEVLTGGRGLGCKSDFFLLHELLWGKNAVLISLFLQPKYLWELRSQLFPQEMTPGYKDANAIQYCTSLRRFTRVKSRTGT